jgi:hypothetical protein
MDLAGGRKNLPEIQCKSSSYHCQLLKQKPLWNVLHVVESVEGEVAQREIELEFPPGIAQSHLQLH